VRAVFFPILREEAHSAVISVLSVTLHLKVEEVVSKQPFAYKALKIHSQIAVLLTIYFMFFLNL